MPSSLVESYIHWRARATQRAFQRKTRSDANQRLGTAQLWKRKRFARLAVGHVIGGEPSFLDAPASLTYCKLQELLLAYRLKRKRAYSITYHFRYYRISKILLE
jgi:hypothetical protein